MDVRRRRNSSSIAGALAMIGLALVQVSGSLAAEKTAIQTPEAMSRSTPVPKTGELEIESFSFGGTAADGKKPVEESRPAATNPPTESASFTYTR
jgi:hypothetical protein